MSGNPDPQDMEERLIDALGNIVTHSRYDGQAAGGTRAFYRVPGTDITAAKKLLEKWGTNRELKEEFHVQHDD